MGKQTSDPQDILETVARYTLRPETEQDQEFLYRLYASTRADEMAIVDWSDEQKESFLRMQFNAQHSYYLDNYPSARFDIVEQQDEPIGRLYVDRSDDEIRVIDIALLPKHRGRGLGSRLMRALLDEAAEVGKPVSIHVERFNPAMRLYQRLGFAPIADEGVYKLMKWSPPMAGRAEDSPET